MMHSKKAPTPRTARVQQIVERFIRNDENGEYLRFEDAELVLDHIFRLYSNVVSQYERQRNGTEILVVNSLCGKTEFLRVRVLRDN